MFSRRSVHVQVAGKLHIDWERCGRVFGGFKCFTFTPGPRFDLFADVTHEPWDYALASRYGNVTAGVGTDNPQDNWTSDADDDYDTLNAGFWAYRSLKRFHLIAAPPPQTPSCSRRWSGVRGSFCMS